MKIRIQKGFQLILYFKSRKKILVTCLTFYFPLVWPENFYAITFGRDEITAELTCINKNNSLHNGYRGELIYW